MRRSQRSRVNFDCVFLAFCVVVLEGRLRAWPRHPRAMRHARPHPPSLHPPPAHPPALAQVLSSQDPVATRLVTALGSRQMQVLYVQYCLQYGQLRSANSAVKQFGLKQASGGRACSVAACMFLHAAVTCRFAQAVGLQQASCGGWRGSSGGMCGWPGGAQPSIP